MQGNKMTPSISIITAVYNGESTISNCLESVRNQNYPHEHLIIDGNSTDNTLELVRHLSPHARVVSEPDRGIYDAMNKGINLASGEVIGILNSDDFYAHHSVLSRVAAVFKNQEIDSCYGDLIYVKEVERADVIRADALSLSPDSRTFFKMVRYWKSSTFTPRRFYWGWMPPHPTFFVRKSIYEKHRHFSLEQGTSADYELMLRFLVKEGISTAYIPEVLVHMRDGGVSNSSWQNRLKANSMDRKAWQVNNLSPFPWTLWLKPLRKIPQWFLPQFFRSSFLHR